MYKLKENPEDFIVDEILNDGTTVSENKSEYGQGSFVWLGIKKINWNTIDLAREIAKRCRVSEKRVNYGGIKDRVATAYQVFSVNTREDCEKIVETVSKIKDIEVLWCKRRNRWFKNEDFIGNRFEIVLRDTSFGVQDIKHVDKFPNYFGEQRFGSMHKNSHIVGLDLLRSDYDRAIKEYFSGELISEKEKLLYEKSKKYSPEKFVKTYWRVFRLCLNAFQSYLFNRELEMRIRDENTGVLKGEYSCGRNRFGFADVNIEGNEFTVAQIIGSKCILNEYKVALLDEYKLRPEHFERFGLKGGVRTLYAPIVGFETEVCGERCIKLRFMIQKGAYATILIKEVCGSI